MLKKLRDRTKIHDQMKAMKYETFFFKEVFGLKDPEKLNKENIDYNSSEKAKLLSFIEKNLANHRIITNDTVVYYDKL